MKPHPRLKLVAPCARPACKDTVYIAERLLKDARSGLIQGFAIACIAADGDYFVDAVGKAKRNPTFARGMVAALDDEMRRLAHEEADAAPDREGW